MKMNVYKWIVIGLAFGILFAGAAAFGDELLLNTGFEDWTSGDPDNWVPNSGSLTGTEETSQIHGGSKSLKADWTTQSTVYFTQTLSINSGANYSYSGWAYDNDPAGRVRLYIRFRDTGGSLVGTSLSSDGYTEDSTAWQELTIAESAAPMDAVTAEFQFRFYDVSENWAGSATAYIDDASMQGSGGDLTPPSDTLIRVIDGDSIEITFNEDVEQTSAETASNYSVDNSVGNPSAATRDGSDSSKVTLDFSSPLPDTKLTITIDGVEDLSSNPTSGLTAEFIGVIKAPGDVDDVNTPDGDQVYEGVYGTVRGIVTATEINNQNLTIAGVSSQDGIEVRDNSTPIGGVSRGDQVVVAGVISHYNGMAQVQGAPVYYNVESSGNPEPAPQDVALTTITNIDEEGANAFSGEAYEGNLVRITGVLIGNNMGNSRTDGEVDPDGLFDGGNYEVSKGGATGVIRIDSDTNIMGETIITGGEYSITGILTQYDYSSPYNAAYSLYPRSKADLSVVAPTSAGGSWTLYE